MTTEVDLDLEYDDDDRDKLFILVNHNTIKGVVPWHTAGTATIYARKEVCVYPGCGTVLNQYNPKTTCWRHRSSGTLRRALRKLGAPLEEEYEEETSQETVSPEDAEAEARLDLYS